MLVAARFMEIDEFGRLTAAVALSGIAATLADAGSKNAGIELAMIGRARPIDPGLNYLRGIGTFSVVVIVSVASGWADVLDLETRDVLAAALIIAPQVAIMAQEQYHRGVHATAAGSLFQGLTGTLIGVVAAVASLVNWGALTVLVAVGVLSWGVTATFGERVWIVDRSALDRARVSKAAWHLALSVSVALYTRADRVILASSAGAQSAGIYNAAYSIVMLGAVAGSTASILAASYGARLSARHLRQLVLVSVCILAGGAVVSYLAWPFLHDFILGLRGGGGERAGVTRHLSLLLVLYPANGLLSGLLLAWGRGRSLGLVGVGLACVALGLYLGVGVRGVRWMALSSVLVECVGFAIQLILVLRYVLSTRLDVKA